MKMRITTLQFRLKKQETKHTKQFTNLNRFMREKESFNQK